MRQVTDKIIVYTSDDPKGCHVFIDSKGHTENFRFDNERGYRDVEHDETSYYVCLEPTDEPEATAKSLHYTLFRLMEKYPHAEVITEKD
ncbi:hypothetical protein [Vibrio panuliri]|uniref:Uncharacterized protein n=1 Tax=Vibrio panuliri TaxID=1381081 RepID=A0ABX3FFX1_9VIBR|nr:hypothetical protein [Vibrio panuliri]KAB1460878.1 hypothetical protein F7O85_00440 [Vibrio panuliri]OLQ91683.1 hypothetical protein BIY20_09780 [Vibrio panuliri]